MEFGGGSVGGRLCLRLGAGNPPATLALGTLQPAPKGGTGVCGTTAGSVPAGTLQARQAASSGGGRREEPWTGSCPRAWLPAPGSLCRDVPAAPSHGPRWALAGPARGPGQPGSLRQQKANAAQGHCPTASDHPCPGQASTAVKIRHAARQRRAREVKPQSQPFPPGSSPSTRADRGAVSPQPMSPPCGARHAPCPGDALLPLWDRSIGSPPALIPFSTAPCACTAGEVSPGTQSLQQTQPRAWLLPAALSRGIPPHRGTASPGGHVPSGGGQEQGHIPLARAAHPGAARTEGARRAGEGDPGAVVQGQAGWEWGSGGSPTPTPSPGAAAANTPATRALAGRQGYFGSFQHHPERCPMLLFINPLAPAQLQPARMEEKAQRSQDKQSQQHPRTVGGSAARAKDAPAEPPGPGLPGGMDMPWHHGPGARLQQQLRPRSRPGRTHACRGCRGARGGLPAGPQVLLPAQVLLLSAGDTRAQHRRARAHSGSAEPRDPRCCGCPPLPTLAPQAPHWDSRPHLRSARDAGGGSTLNTGSGQGQRGMQTPAAHTDLLSSGGRR